MPPDVTAGIFWLKNRDPESGVTRRTSITCGKYIIGDRPMTEKDSSDGQAYQRVLDRSGSARRTESALEGEVGS